MIRTIQARYPLLSSHFLPIGSFVVVHCCFMVVGELTNSVDVLGDVSVSIEEASVVVVVVVVVGA